MQLNFICYISPLNASSFLEDIKIAINIIPAIVPMNIPAKNKTMIYPPLFDVIAIIPI